MKAYVPTLSSNTKSDDTREEDVPEQLNKSEETTNKGTTNKGTQEVESTNLDEGKVLRAKLAKVCYRNCIIEPEGELPSHQSQAEHGTFDSPDKDARRAREGKTPVKKEPNPQNQPEREPIDEKLQEQELEDDDDDEADTDAMKKGLSSKVKSKGASVKHKVRDCLLSSIKYKGS